MPNLLNNFWGKVDLNLLKRKAKKHSPMGDNTCMILKENLYNHLNMKKIIW